MFIYALQLIDVYYNLCVEVNTNELFYFTAQLSSAENNFSCFQNPVIRFYLWSF